MNWSDASEVVCGLVLTKKIAINAVRYDQFIAPYSDIIKLLKKENVAIEDIIERIGLSPVQASLDAAKSVNGLGDSNWVSILEKSAIAYDAGSRLEKMGRKLQQGGEVDWASITTIAHNAQNGTGGEFIALSDIEPGEIPFKLTGFVAIDEHLGGLPKVGQVLVAAASATGKSTFMVGLASCYAKLHTDENVGIFTLEMTKEEIALRFREINKLPDEVKSRILINDGILTPEEVVSKAATIEHLGLVCVDFADLLIKGETTESAMAHIYRTFMLGSKQLGVPIVLLAQLNRGYSGGIPRPTDVRYTGLAEALSWMVLMLYNPSKDWFAEETSENTGLPIVEGTAYIIAWKQRGGFRKHLDDSPGAIQLQFRGDRGWRLDSPGRWFNLNKLSS